ncbi:hypothetical protein ACQ4M3_20590 [Leptolyngbya sp. AN03gr2]|uniref:hypothetical protein n=1 Tax=unclassified Leptolyngbya TaxID=2650499 RepID=UPI003D310517
MQPYQKIEEAITPEFHIWAGLDSEINKWLAEILVKTEGGIKQLIHWYPSYNLEQYKQDCEQWGKFSKRPFQVGRTCDGSGDACCHALFYRFCQEYNLDPILLHRQAYSWQNDYTDLTPTEIQGTIKKAEWEGVLYPKKWTTSTVGKLLQSLYDINNRSLVRVLEEAELIQQLNQN